MVNAEKYKSEIKEAIEITKKHNNPYIVTGFAVDKNTHEVMPCLNHIESYCEGCALRRGLDCNYSRVIWLLTEEE